MMNRASQEWPDEHTVEIPAEPQPEPGQKTATLITDLTNIVERAERGNHEKESKRVQIEMPAL